MLGFGAADKMTTIVRGQMAPHFTLRSTDGQEYSLANLLERGPVVAAFYKVSCPVCQFTFPFLERLYQRYGRGEVTFLGIGQDSSLEAQKFARQYAVTFPMITDEKGYPASNAYGLTNVPSIFLIAADGTVHVSSTGFARADLERIARELAERQKSSAVPLFSANEQVPDYKPG